MRGLLTIEQAKADTVELVIEDEQKLTAWLG